jgi:pyruvate dehydrogenase E2 component (dihydrolipoamide acetyltransferase)
MPINITMPALSPTMEEGNLAKWLVKEGDTVKSGDVIAEIETDKATMEVEAVDEGVLAKLVVPAGTEGVKVNAVIAVLAAEGEDVKAAAAGAKCGAAAPKAEAAPVATPAPAAARRTSPAATPAACRCSAPTAAGLVRWFAPFASPLARVSPRTPASISAIAGSGPHGRVVKSRCRKSRGLRHRQGSAGARHLPLPAAGCRAAARQGQSDEAFSSCSRRFLRTRAA